MAFGGYDGTIRIDSRIEEKGFNQGVKRMGSALKPLAAAIAATFAVGAVVAFGKSAVSAASQLAAAMTGLKSVLDGTGKSFAEGQKFINDYIADGLVPATEAITAYKNLALRGYDTSQIEKTLIALKDSAAFGRQASLTMGEAIRSASEGLKNENSILVDNAGVTKNIAKMWEDYAKSIGTTAQALTKQQKIQAEVNGILQETRFQTGDAAKLSGQYSGMVAALGVSFYNLKVALGNAIIPVLTQIIPLIKQVIDGLVVMVNQVAQFVAVLFGVKLGVDAVAGSTQAAADATSDLADAQLDATKAAEGALAAFDELNVLQMDTATPAATEAVTPAVDPAPVDDGLSTIEERVKAFKDKLAKLLGPAAAAFGRLKEALAPLGEKLGEGLKWLYDNVLVPLGKWALESLLPAVIDLLAAAFTVLNSVLDALKPLGVWLWEEFLKPAGEWVGDKIIEALGWLTEKLYDLSDWIETHQAAVRQIAIIFGVIAAAILVYNVVMAVAGAVTAAFAIVMAVLTSPILLVALAVAALVAVIYILITHWKEVKIIAGAAWEYIKKKWGEAKGWFKTSVTDPIADLFDVTWLLIRTLASAAWSKTKEVWQDAKQWFGDKVITPISDWFKNAWEDIRKFASNAWLKVKEVWQDALTWFQTSVVDPVKNAFNVALDWIQNKFSTIFTGVKDTVKAAINSIIGFLNTMIYAMTTALNTVINAMNSLNFTVPGWVPLIGGNSWGVNMMPILATQIPYLATGAVVPPHANMLAMIGEGSQREIVAPEDTIRRIVREESRNTGQQEVAIRFTGNMAQLVRLLKPEIDRENNRVGGSLIKARLKS